MCLPSKNLTKYKYRTVIKISSHNLYKNIPQWASIFTQGTQLILASVVLSGIRDGASVSGVQGSF